MSNAASLPQCYASICSLNSPMFQLSTFLLSAFSFPLSPPLPFPVQGIEANRRAVEARRLAEMGTTLLLFEAAAAVDLMDGQALLTVIVVQYR